MKKTTLYIILYFAMFVIHFSIWYFLNLGFEVIFLKYYLFLTLLFMMVITFLSIFKQINPQKIGYLFLGLVFFKLIMVFIIKKKLNLIEIPNYKFHFIFPYLISLVLETLYAVELVKGEKNH
jgi:hypothetical protein